METSEIIRQVGALSYLGIFGISFLANVVVPVPEEVVILAIGYVVGAETMNFWIVLPIVMAGMLLSDLIMFSASFLVNLRFIGPFFAGQAKMPYKKFFLIDGAAILIYASILLWAGHYFSDRIESIFSGVGTVKNVILVVIGVVLLITIMQAIKKAFLRFEMKGLKK